MPYFYHRVASGLTSSYSDRSSNDRTPDRSCERARCQAGTRDVGGLNWTRPRRAITVRRPIIIIIRRGHRALLGAQKITGGIIGLCPTLRCVSSLSVLQERRRETCGCPTFRQSRCRRNKMRTGQSIVLSSPARPLRVQRGLRYFRQPGAQPTRRQPHRAPGVLRPVSPGSHPM